MKSISQTKKKGKLVQIGTKLGRDTIFFHIICYVDNGKDYIELTQILGTPKWEFEILKLSTYESCDFGAHNFLIMKFYSKDFKKTNVPIEYFFPLTYHTFQSNLVCPTKH